MFLTSSANFFSAGQKQTPAGPRFGLLASTPQQKAVHAPGSDSETDSLCNAALDKFEPNKFEFDKCEHQDESGRATPVPKEQSQRAFQRIIQNTLTRLRESFAEPPEEMVLGVKSRKWEVAGQLSDWMQNTLQQQGVQLAVVARQGSLEHKKHDKTGMLHAGLAMYHPREQRWKIYNLIDTPFGGSSRCDVQWTEPAAFFARQGGYRKDALLLIPDAESRRRMHQSLLNGDYRKLVFTPDYNLVSPPHSDGSLNCNKWVLLNVLAAKHDTTDTAKLLSHIRDNYQPGQINVHPLKRLFAAQEPKVKASEVPWLAPIHTVTVESLLNSGLFEKAQFCEPREGQA